MVSREKKIALSRGVRLNTRVPMAFSLRPGRHREESVSERHVQAVWLQHAPGINNQSLADLLGKPSKWSSHSHGSSTQASYSWRRRMPCSVPLNYFPME